MSGSTNQITIKNKCLGIERQNRYIRTSVDATKLLINTTIPLLGPVLYLTMSVSGGPRPNVPYFELFLGKLVVVVEKGAVAERNGGDCTRSRKRVGNTT